MTQQIDRQQAVDLLHGLVSVPSLSRQEAEASQWLVDQMSSLGYDRTYVDEAGNAVGEIGPEDAEKVLILLGHIDTVPGNIPVRVVSDDEQGDLLYGRGSVDAKGPLATFVVAVAKFKLSHAELNDFRVVVVGAVEEEAATSKGARYIRERFDGTTSPLPVGCIIGEPSQWRRITLGYKGRMLVELDAEQPMAHTAGPGAGVAIIGIDLWNRIWAYAEEFNQGRDKLFDRLMPSLRRLNTSTSEEMMDRVSMQIGIRLPLDFDADGFGLQITEWLAESIHALPPDRSVGKAGQTTLVGPDASATIRFHGHEPAWQGDRRNSLVRSFLGAIRSVDPNVRPGFASKTGTSDMNVVGPAWQCPILAYGPGDSALDHTPNEHIRFDEYWKAVLILEKAMSNYLQGMT